MSRAIRQFGVLPDGGVGETTATQWQMVMVELAAQRKTNEPSAFFAALHRELYQ